MMDKNKTKAQLINELEELRTRTASLEASATESERVEDTLRKSEESYRAVVEDQTELICRFLPDKTLTFVNNAYCRFFGLKRDELIGFSFMRLIPESEHEYVENHFASLNIENPAAMHEHQVIAPNGEIHWQQWTNRAIFDDEERIIEFQSVGRDITDRKRTEDELRQSEERYRVLVETIPHGVQKIDASGTITFVNSAHCNMHGYREEELIGESVLNLVASDSEREELSEYLAILVKEQPEPIPYVGQDRTKDGRIKDIQVDWDYEKDDHGRVTGFVSVLTDVTERMRAEEELRKAHDDMEQKVKERTSELLEANEQLRREIENRKGAEERLRESEAYMRGILNAAPAGIGLVRERELDWISNRMCEMLGYSADELVGQSARIAYESGEEFERVGRVKYAEIQKQGFGSVETRFKHKDGKVLDVLLCSSAVDPHDLSKGAIFTALDITERKQAEEELRESEEKYRRLVETSIDGIAIVQGTEMKFANKALLDMYGATGAEEIIGHNFTKFVAHEHRDLLMERGLDRERGKEVPNRYEFKALKLDGNEFDVEISVNPISYEGKPARQAVVRDISERKRTEGALREGKEKYRLLVENLPSIVYRGYKDWSVDFFDEKVEVLTGHSMEEFNSRMIRWSDLIVEEDIAGARETFIKALKTDKSYVREYRIKPKSGGILWIQERARIICDDKGEIDHVNGVFFDITERKRAEEALRESEHYFRSLLFSMHEDILVIDRDYRITDVNNTLLVTVGREYEEVIGSRCYEVSHGYNEPCEKKGEDCMLREVFETGKPGNSRHQHIRADGSQVWVDILLSPLKDENGNVVHVIEAIRDVTDLMEMEDVLRESEENFRALAENAHDGILIAAGTEGMNLYANRRAAEITGYSVTELLEIGLHELVAPEEVKKVADRYKRRLAGKNVPSQYETKIVRKSKEIFPAELSSARSTWKGEPASIILIRDITDRKRAEEAVRKSEIELIEKSRHLEEVNAALKVLLNQRENDKADLEERLLANVKELVMPYVEKLKNSRLHSDQMTLVGILESNMKEIVSPFVTRLSSRFLSLTPTEIQVASLIKDGKTSKEIAALLNASENTVRTHRFHIRSKLGIKNRKVNFRSYLQSLRD